MNHFIRLDYKQFVKISHETIAPWPLFPHTFITGAGVNRITAILGLGHKQNLFRRAEFSVTEC